MPITRSLPRFAEVYREAKELRKLLSQAEKLRKEILAKAREDASGVQLVADNLITDIINAAKMIEIGDDTLARAKKRNELDNSPGKKGGLGDRLNWEALLSVVPELTDLRIVTRDGDYNSPLRPIEPHGFLSNEWTEKKSSGLYLHREIKRFMSEHFPDIKFAADITKSEAINNLIHSGSFAATHAAIANLLPIADSLNDEDVLKLARAAVDNNQINWVALDEDVKSFYKSILPKAAPLYDKDLENKLLEGFGLAPGDLV